MSTYLRQWTVFTYFRLQANIPALHTIYILTINTLTSVSSGFKFCLHFSSGQETEARSRRSLASASGDQAGAQHYEDQHPPNITPVGGVPNLKVISQQYPRLKLHNKFHPEPRLCLKCSVIR